MSLIENNEMNISFIYESQMTNTINCNINEKLINILSIYSNIIGKKYILIFYMQWRTN